MTLRRLLPLFGLFLLFSCHPAKGPGSASRKKLVAELHKLRGRVISRKKDDMAKCFQFPIPDSMMSIYIEDTSYSAWHEGNPFLTKEWYDKIYPKLVSEWDLKQWGTLFRKISLDSLNVRDSVGVELHPKNEACYSMINVQVEGDSLVTISYGTNSNPDYHPAKVAGETDDENACPEHATIWEFLWDGKVLRFKKQLAAG